jgi:Tfp pilus assembly protein PilO
MNHLSENPNRSVASRFKMRPPQNIVMCHAIGTLVTAVLLAGIVWISQNRLVFAGDQNHTASQVSKATELISNADTIRQRFANLQSDSSTYRSKAKTIEDWLPPSINFDQQRTSLQQVANECGLRLTRLKREQQYDGKRLSVVAATCRVDGTLDQICLFLHKLPATEAPIWCNGVSLEQSSENGARANECTAQIHLRLPFVGQNTIAEKLTQVYQSNAT